MSVLLKTPQDLESRILDSFGFIFWSCLGIMASTVLSGSSFLYSTAFNFRTICRVNDHVLIVGLVFGNEFSLFLQIGYPQISFQVGPLRNPVGF